jgi:ribosomal protein S18 acetylase RimI-like enzyme
MPLVYKTGSLADQAALMALAQEAYQVYEPILGPEHWPQLAAFLQDSSRFEALIRQSTVFQCMDGDRLAGAAYLVPSGNPAFVYQADWSYVRMVGVATAYQGQGIARHLMQLCIDQARLTGETLLALHTAPFMTGAIQLYERLGFRRHQDIGMLYGQPYWLYSLSLT